MHGVLSFLLALAVVACLRVGPCLASPTNRGDVQAVESEISHRSRRSPSPQFFSKTTRPRLGLGSLIGKHKGLHEMLGKLSTGDNKPGLLEQSSVLSTREQKHAVSHKLGDKENHSVSSVKTLDEKHAVATADGFGGQSQNVSSLSTTDEQLSSSKFVGGIGQHAVSSKQTEDEQHTASEISGAGEEKHLSSASKAVDEKHSVFASGTEGVIPFKQSTDQISGDSSPSRAAGFLGSSLASEPVSSGDSFGLPQVSVSASSPDLDQSENSPKLPTKHRYSRGLPDSPGSWSSISSSSISDLFLSDKSSRSTSIYTSGSDPAGVSFSGANNGGYTSIISGSDSQDFTSSVTKTVAESYTASDITGYSASTAPKRPQVFREISEYLKPLRVKKPEGAPKIVCYRTSGGEADVRNRRRAVILPEPGFFKTFQRKTLVSQVLGSDLEQSIEAFEAKPREILGYAEDVVHVLANTTGIVGGSGTDLIAEVVAGLTPDGLITPVVVDRYEAVGFFARDKIFEAVALLEVVPKLAKIVQLRPIVVKRGSYRLTGRKTFERASDDVIECEEEMEVDKNDSQISEQVIMDIIRKYFPRAIETDRKSSSSVTTINFVEYVGQKLSGPPPDVDPDDDDPTPIRNELAVEYTKQKLRKVEEERRRAQEDIEIRDRIDDSRRAAERSRLEVLRLEEERAKLESLKKFQELARRARLELEDELQSIKRQRTVQDEEVIRRLRLEEEEVTKRRNQEDIERQTLRKKLEQEHLLKRRKEEEEMKVRLKVQMESLEVTRQRVESVLINRRRQEDGTINAVRKREDEQTKTFRVQQDEDITERRRREDEEIARRRRAEDQVRSAVRVQEDTQTKTRRSVEDEELSRRRTIENQQELERLLVERSQIDHKKRVLEQEFIYKRQHEDKQRAVNFEKEDSEIFSRRKREDDERKLRVAMLLEETQRQRVIQDQEFSKRLKQKEDELEALRLKEEQDILANIQRLKDAARLEIARKYAERLRVEFDNKRRERERYDASVREEEEAKIEALRKIIDAREKILELREATRLRDKLRQDEKRGRVGSGSSPVPDAIENKVLAGLIRETANERRITVVSDSLETKSSSTSSKDLVLSIPTLKQLPTLNSDPRLLEASGASARDRELIARARDAILRGRLQDATAAIADLSSALKETLVKEALLDSRDSAVRDQVLGKESSTLRQHVSELQEVISSEPSDRSPVESFAVAKDDSGKGKGDAAVGDEVVVPGNARRKVAKCVRRAVQQGGLGVSRPPNNSGSRIRVGAGNILDSLLTRSKSQPPVSLADPASQTILAPIVEVLSDSVPAESLKSLSLKPIRTSEGDSIGLFAGSNTFLTKFGVDVANPNRKVVTFRRVVQIPSRDAFRPADKAIIECIQEYEDYAKEHSSLEASDDVKLRTYLFYERPPPQNSAGKKAGR